MNDILIFTVDTTLNHSTRAKKCAVILLKMRRNEQDLERCIINEWEIFNHSHNKGWIQISTRLSSALRLQVSNSMPENQALTCDLYTSVSHL